MFNFQDNGSNMPKDPPWDWEYIIFWYTKYITFWYTIKGWENIRLNQEKSEPNRLTNIEFEDIIEKLIENQP